MIKLIIFDLGKVILDFSYFKVAEDLAAYSDSGLYKDPGNIMDYILNNGKEINAAYETGHITSDEFFVYIRDIFGLGISFPQFRQIWSDIFTENEGMGDLIEQMKKDFTLFLLSNTNELHFEFVKQKFPVVHKFDEWILSYEVGVKKPDPAIFEIALQGAGVEAEEAIFVDDIREHVTGAQGLGINAVEFKSVEQITRFIEEKVYEQSTK